jgi:predicted dehydrogenase
MTRHPTENAEQSFHKVLPAMIRIGIVGIGFMGMIHYLAAQRLTGGRVTAICSRDPRKRAGDWRGIRGNFGPPGQQMDLRGLKTYDRLEALLADPEIDLVDICNPTHLHAATAEQALRAGKHVLVEKAITLTVPQADALLATARHAGRLLLVAHVLPFFPEFAFALQAVHSGRYGRLLGGHFFRLISRPDWSADIADPAKTGGPAVDLHVHDTHFLRLLCGMPRRVAANGVLQDGVVYYLNTNYLYDPPGQLALSCASGALVQKGRPFVHGFELYLEQATLVYQGGVTPLTVLTADGRAEQPLAAGAEDALTAFAAELQAAVEAVRTGQVPPALDSQAARDALLLCYRECDAVRLGEPVAVG